MKKYWNLLMTGLMVITVSTFGTQAYLIRNTDTLTNRIAPGSVTVAVTEPDWNPEDGNGLVPEKVIAKNPQVTNLGTLDAWVMLRVKIPRKTIALVDPVTRRKMEKENTEIVTFEKKDGWTLLSEQNSDEQTEYVYGYQKSLAPGETTESLFESIRMVNYLEGELDSDEILEIPIESIAIQKDAIGAKGSVEQAYAIISGGTAS